MSNKSNLSSILGVAAATVLAAGGSAAVTDTGLRMYDKQTNAIVQETEVAVVEKETELPVKVETFAATKDSFTVKPVSDSGNKKDTSKKDTDKDKKNNETTIEGEGSSENGQSNSQSGGSGSDSNYIAEGSSSSGDGSSSSGSSGSGSSNGSTPVSFDEWGGWVAANGDYYDGQGGYWDGNGYHYVGESIKTPEGAANYKPSSGSSGSGSSGSSGSDYSGGWDDSYILYDTAVRYLSKGELSDWGEWELAAARNEIFARHGRIFVTPEWSSYFATKSWYTPKYSNVDDLLNDYEWANLDLIMKLEEKYY